MLIAGVGLDSRPTTTARRPTATTSRAASASSTAPTAASSLGGDLRLGGRSIDDDQEVYPLAGVAYYAPSTLRDGEYRSARAYVGVRF